MSHESDIASLRGTFDRYSSAMTWSSATVRYEAAHTRLAKAAFNGRVVGLINHYVCARKRMSLAIESVSILHNLADFIAMPDFDFAIPFRRGRVKTARRKRKKVHSITKLIYTLLVSHNVT